MKTLAFLLPLFVATAHAQTWTPQVSGTAEDLNDVYFLDAVTGFVVADGGLVLSTTDGGQTWNAQTIGGGLDLEGIAFNPSGSVGVIATGDGPVLRSTDGGATWTVVGTGAGDLRAVDWAGDNTAWVAGRDAAGAISTDAGQTWTFHSTGALDRTEAIAAVSATEAWVANRSGGLQHTADGGASWTSQPSGTAEDLNDIQMLDESTGYIVSTSDTILKTTSGGTTWTNVSAGGADGNGLHFLDATTGWVVGDGGEIWFTSNGGMSWALHPSGTSAAFSRVHFADAQHGWAVGDGGVIVAFGTETTGTDDTAEAATFTLGTPSPNPFADQATVVLRVDVPQQVRVEVFDVLGRRVALLYDGSLVAGATRTLRFEAAGLAGGAYFVRASGATFAVVRRAVVLR